MRPDGMPGDLSGLSKARIQYIPATYGIKSKALEASHNRIRFDHWNALDECDIIIAAVNANDIELLGTKISSLLETKKDIVIFSMMRGIKNNTRLKEFLTSGGKSVVIIDCIIGFGVVVHPNNNKCLISTTTKPKIIMDRLTKEIMDQADGPVNLIESLKFDIIFKRGLTPFSHGNYYYYLMLLIINHFILFSLF